MSGIRAWLVTWDWANDAAAKVDKVAAILPADWPINKVAEVVTLLYAQATSTARELAVYAESPDNNPYRAEIYEARGRPYVSCGPNPHLSAELVIDLVVHREDKTGLEIISWATTQVDGVTPRTRHTFRRDINGALSSADIWDREHGRMQLGFEHRVDQ